MSRITPLCLILFIIPTIDASAETRFEPNWQSLDSRPTPAWFDEAKFGIFVVWGPYSVPAWAPKGEYAEWYWWRINNPNDPTYAFHRKTYGENFRYQDFLPDFTAELFDPNEWADLFVRSGAKYVVMTAQYHDGFCLWPSPFAWNWNSVDVGPHRDLVGELTAAVRARELKMGYYYSVYEWYHPLHLTDIPRYVDEHFHPQVKHLVETYKPDILWADGEWTQSSEVWKTPNLLAWLFNEAVCRKTIAVNDRWGNDCRGRHGGFYTTEYGKHTDVEMTVHHKWEENRGMGSSYGYNRNENIDDYNTATQLIHLLVDMVAKGGNLLLDVGPTADGRIPVIMQQRLLEIGEWLNVNGEAVYGAQAWRAVAEGEKIRFTAKGDSVYAICLDWPGAELALSTPKSTNDTSATMLGCPTPLQWNEKDGMLCIKVPRLTIDQLPTRHAYVFKLTNVK
ncbi:MAG: alpha-L-fucosidase [Candidatus Omnitrophota bacterium]|jgi:alpha-L-fucosidase|nr:MAG: alpha-L-fucosidase [Candidatus Omnitrophota bacterium]